MLKCVFAYSNFTSNKVFAEYLKMSNTALV
jgi:hypothetical protein